MNITRIRKEKVFEPFTIEFRIESKRDLAILLAKHNLSVKYLEDSISQLDLDIGSKIIVSSADTSNGYNSIKGICEEEGIIK